ncbi:hypothetical protein SEA_CECE_219 [Microbacterium phage Cece]|nr:hypothetical protein SEA_CECE_219 [Microbacterium phage Cece]
MTDNYIDARHEYLGEPNDEGVRVKRTDVWYAVRPTAPHLNLVTPDGEDDPDLQVDVTTAWTLHNASTTGPLIIVDQDDIDGLRKLLDAIEQKMHDENMDKLYAEFDSGLDTDDKDA